MPRHPEFLPYRRPLIERAGSWMRGALFVLALTAGILAISEPHLLKSITWALLAIAGAVLSKGR